MAQENACTVRLPRPSGQVNLDPAPTYDVTKLSDERTKTLDRLLKQGHISVAPLRNPKLILHSHLPHVYAPAQHLAAAFPPYPTVATL